MFRKVLLFLCLMVFSMGAASAQYEEWSSKTFPFQSIKTIMVAPINYPNNNVPEVSKRNIDDVTAQKLNLKNVKIMTFADITAIMTHDGYDFSKHTPQEVLADEIKVIGQYTDATLFINVLEYSTGSTYIEPSSYTYQTTDTSTVKNLQGNIVGYTSTPTTHEVHVPGGNVPMPTANIKFALYDSKSQQLIFSRKDDRARANVTRLNHTTPQSLYKRIISSCSSSLNRLIGAKD